jgi:hypothetical protein
MGLYFRGAQILCPPKILRQIAVFSFPCGDKDEKGSHISSHTIVTQTDSDTMCYSFTRTNEKDVANNVGKKYVAICERNDPIISQLVVRLNAVMKTRRANLRRQLERNLTVLDPERPRDPMPRNIPHFPHHCEKTYSAFLPIFTSTEKSLSWQLFAGFLASMNDAGFSRRALYELLRMRAEAHDDHNDLTAEDKGAFSTFADKMSSNDGQRNVSRDLRPRKERKRWAEWQSAYQPPSGYSHIVVNGISYPIRIVGRTEVDWWMERGSIIVPEDGKTAMMLLELQCMGLWNFVSTWNQVKSSGECWQNILIQGLEFH